MMSIERAIRIAANWADGKTNTLREGEAQEYHKMALAALRAQQEREDPQPLTLEELRKMDGEPVWDNFLMEWCIVMMELCNGKGAVKYFDGGFNRLSEKRFCRHKPKEDPHE